MRSLFLVAVISLFLIENGSAQITSKTLKKIMTLKMPEGEGENGAGVAYNLATKRYYAAFAGNSNFELAVFNHKGKLLEEGSQTTMVDIRGLWFNTKKNKLQGNGYGETGWFEYVLNAKGIPKEVNTIYKGANQPHDQCAGAFNARANEVYFFDGETLSVYDAATGEVKTSMMLEDMLQDEDFEENEVVLDYSKYTVLYTGMLNKEIGLINETEHRIELFDLKGTKTMHLELPHEQPIYPLFNISYSNGMFWLFNIEMRTWTAYK